MLLPVSSYTCILVFIVHFIASQNKPVCACSMTALNLFRQGDAGLAENARAACAALDCYLLLTSGLWPCLAPSPFLSNPFLFVQPPLRSSSLASNKNTRLKSSLVGLMCWLRIEVVILRLPIIIVVQSKR